MTNFLIAASQMKTEIDNLASQYPNTEPVLLEMHRSLDEIDKLVADNDVVLRFKKFHVSIFNSPENHSL